ncbi:hypothetical protein [Streptomyces drozdowiczii]|uniref:hypothetical protein n=1 Tax=Streptomyces drozdowiczii TaxID=202862 RepID=UPI00403CF93D
METSAPRRLPSVGSLSEHQQRGWRCCWCRWQLHPGYDRAVGEIRVAPERGAAYTVFLRECADTEECQARAPGNNSPHSTTEPDATAAS